MHERKHLKRTLYGFLAALVLSGCTTSTGERPRFPKLGDLTAAVTEVFESDPRSKSNPTAEALYKDGIDYFEKGRYARSISFFQKLRDEYPFSEEAEAAELKIAEAYYLNEEYVQAGETYKNYLTFQPTGRHVHHVKYQLGRVNLAQFTGVDRDLEKVKEARGYFASVVKDHPDSEHVPDARKKLAETREHLAERELYVGNHYLKEERYPAARARFENVLRDYADTTAAPKARDALSRVAALEEGAPETPAPRDGAGAETSREAVETPAKFVTKEGYEYEDPVQRRWYSYLNPLSWRGRRGEPEEEASALRQTAAGEAQASTEDPAPAEKKKSWFSFLNPFSSSGEDEKEPAKPGPGETASAKAVVKGIDKTLGTGESSGGDAPKPPVSELPPEEKEAGPIPGDPAAVLGDVDTRLGGETPPGSLPQAPAADPALFSARKPDPDAKERAADESGSGLLEGIDRQLGREGPPELPRPPASP